MKTNVSQNKKKCIVWDLDNTIWDGVLTENNKVKVKENVLASIREFDRRGILQSIASKNEHVPAFNKLKELDIHDYFLYPQINWNTKSSSIKSIKNSLNIGMDTIAFIDDQEYELDEVKFNLPEVFCINSKNIDSLLTLPEFIPHFITEDSAKRRLMYQCDIKRNEAEDAYEGPTEEFLSTLGMSVFIRPARESDLKRAEELTQRTHQLNTTGYTYSYNELLYFMKLDNYILLIAGLDDKYGTYGKIGLALIECKPDKWIIKLLLMSCRVMNRGIGTILITYIMKMAREKRKPLYAEFIKTDVNRMMYISYKFNGFKEVGNDNGNILFQNDLENIQNYPDYIKLNVNK